MILFPMADIREIGKRGGRRMSRVLICVMALVLSGCAVSSSTIVRPSDLYDPPEYPFYYDALWADLFWRCITPEGGGIRVEGYAISSMRSSMAVLGFEVQLLARDAKGNILVDRWSWGDPIDADNITPIAFALAVPAAAAYDLRYRFQAPDNGNGDGGGTGHRRQEPPVVLVRGGFEVFGTIEDVCSDQYRRKAGQFGS
jgi:hypothetical protein